LWYWIDLISLANPVASHGVGARMLVQFAIGLLKTADLVRRPGRSESQFTKKVEDLQALKIKPTKT